MIPFHEGWFTTQEAEDDERHMYRCREVLFAGATRFQKMEILDTFSYGKMLVLDGKVQSSQRDEFIYHEALVHPGMTAHPRPRSVLIVGGGEGASLREVLRHDAVERAVMVELDPDVVRLARTHLKEWHQGAFDDPRTELVFDDGRRRLELSGETFDVIIIDVTDLLDDGPALALYTREFYRLVRRRLAPGGLVIVQGLELGYNDYQKHAVLKATLETAFPLVRSYKTFVPSFRSDWGFLIASQGPDPAAVPFDVLTERLAGRLGTPSPLRFYDAEMHEGLFNIPQGLKRRLAEPARILTDGDLRAPQVPMAAAAGNHA